MYFNISIDVAKVEEIEQDGERVSWPDEIAWHLEALARRLRNTGTPTVSTTPKPSEITGKLMSSLDGKITDDGTLDGAEIGEFSLDETPALGDKLRASPYPPTGSAAELVAIDVAKATAARPIYECALDAEELADTDPEFHGGPNGGPHQCWDGCGACDGCGRWIGDPSLEDTKPIKVGP